MRCKSTFATDAYRNWKHATEMNRHASKYAASKVNLACYSTWKENIKRPEMGKKITSLVITEAIQRNRYYFSTLIDKIAFLATHQLAFKGKIDTFESKEGRGNGLFFSLFNYTVKKDQHLRVIIKTIPQSVSYTSPDMQNQPIAAMSSAVIEGIEQEIGNPWYIIKVDGTKDPTGVENIYIIIRFFQRAFFESSGTVIKCP